MVDFLINTTTTGLQHQPSAAAFRGTHCLVVWADSSDAAIKGQIFQANGTRSGGELTVNAPTPSGSNTDRSRPVVGSTGNGPVVAWIEAPFSVPGPRPHVKAQRFSLDGQKIGPEFQVSTSDVDPGHRPAVIGVSDGGFLVIWVDPRRDQRIRARRFSPFGSTVGPELTVNASDGFHEGPVACPVSSGSYAVAWRSDPSPPGGGGLVVRVLSMDGAAAGPERKPNLFGFTGGKAIAQLDTGQFVITHIRTGADSNIGVRKSTVEVSLFGADGNFSDVGFEVSSERGISTSFPAVAGLPGGRFVVAWVQRSAETFATSPSVRARVLSATQGRLGSEVTVNETAAGDRFSVCAATIFGGGEGETAVVAWADSSGAGGDPSDFGVRGRVLRVLDTGQLI